MQIIGTADMDFTARGTTLELREGQVIDAPDDAAQVAISFGFAAAFDPDAAPAEPPAPLPGPDHESGPEQPGPGDADGGGPDDGGEEEDDQDEGADEVEDLDWPDGVSPKAISALEAAGIDPDGAAAMSDEELLAIPNVGPGTVKALRKGWE